MPVTFKQLIFKGRKKGGERSRAGGKGANSQLLCVTNHCCIFTLEAIPKEMLGFVITSQPVGSRAALSTTPGAAALCWWGRGAAESPQPLVQQLLPRGPYSTSRSVPQQQEAECSSPVPGSRAGLGCAALLPAICTRRAGKTPGGCREEVVQVLFSFGWLVLSCELCKV